MNPYRFNRPITLIMALGFPIWAPIAAACLAIKGAWEDRHFIGGELKDAIVWSLEPITDAFTSAKIKAAEARQETAERASSAYMKARSRAADAYWNTRYAIEDFCWEAFWRVKTAARVLFTGKVPGWF